MLRFAAEPSRGIFWVIDKELFAFPYEENVYSYALGKSGNTYVHKKLWERVRPQGCDKPYNYYPRGRVEINGKGKPIVYMNSNIDESLVLEIMLRFGLKEVPKIRYDNSHHYKCHYDDGWKSDSVRTTSKQSRRTRRMKRDVGYF